MTLQEIRYEADGVVLTGYLADGSQEEPAPGILVAHEAPGLTDHVKERALALAEMGYVALALDLYGAHGLDLDQAREHSLEVMNTPGLLVARAQAALATLAALESVDPDRIAALGFCLGGVAAIELARHNAPIRCAIGFHPGLQRAAGSIDGPIGARVLVMIGDDDPVAPPEARVAFAQSMEDAGADWAMHIFGGVGHSYTNREIDAFDMPGFAYHADADRRSWKLAQMLLEETL